MTVIQQLGRLFVRRFLFPALAFLGASMAASLCVSLVFFTIALWGGEEPLTPTSLFSMLIIALTLGIYIAVYAAIPAAVFIWAIRLTKLRRGWSDAIAGGLTGGPMMHLLLHGLSALTEPPSLMAGIFFLAGVIGGLAYWQLAGRPRPSYSLLQD